MQTVKPWQQHGFRCERCEAPAVSSVSSGDDYPVVKVCDEHVEAERDRYCDEYGSGSSYPITESWWMWFYTTPIGRPIDRSQIAISRWRWDRGEQGKRFGYDLETSDMGGGMFLTTRRR